MNGPIARLLAAWIFATCVVLATLRSAAPTRTTADWIAEHPRRTAGCPGLHHQLAVWQEELSLRDWTIEIECGMNPALVDHLGLVRSEPSKRQARIWIREGLTYGWQGYVVVHELAHVGVAASRWWVPDGREEEEFVETASESVYLSRRLEVQRRMVREAQRRGRDAVAIGPEATARARSVTGTSGTG